MVPQIGPTIAGAARKKNVRPAWALDPVSSRTQIAIASHSAESPRIETDWPHSSAERSGTPRSRRIAIVLSKDVLSKLER